MVGIFTSTAAAVAASTVPYTCVNFMVPVGVQDVTIAVPSLNLSDNYATTALANDLTRRGAPMPTFNTSKLTKTFNISAEYCAPANMAPPTLQILSHGLGFDRSYWDYRPPGSPNSTEYSYVNAAMAAGYSTFAYNRLGIAPSTIADPVYEIQTLVELAVLTNLTAMLRAGAIPQVPKPANVLHVGHSYGSELTFALASTAPSLSDGIIFTGFSNLYSYQPASTAANAFHLANTNQPQRFPPSIYSNGFLVWPDVYFFQYTFLEYPYFSTAVAEDVENTKFPFTVGESISGGFFSQVAPYFTGPVLYMQPSNDFIFCGGNCTGLLNATSPAVTAFNGSSDVTVYIHPNSGHALNVQYNATAAYDLIFEWATARGF